jgi:HNH endonuclease
MKKPFPIQKLKFALRAIEHDITEQQRQMLMMHYANRVASMECIARFAQYGSFHSANSQYGTLAGKIADQLGYKRRDHNRTYTIATACSTRDSKGHRQWRLDDEVAQALEQLGWVSPCEGEAVGSLYSQLADVPDTEREALMKARRGQGVFRNEVVALWSACAVTGCSLFRILVASHIVPWRDASDHERLDPFNGLLLTPNFDSLFDSFLISFEDNGSILLSKNLSTEMRTALGVNGHQKLRFVRPETQRYLERHRRIFLEREQGLDPAHASWVASM